MTAVGLTVCRSTKSKLVSPAQVSEMMRIDENIHATYPPYATLAPILHKQVFGEPMDRNTNLNNGAAA
jgi:hypothetical protein